MRPRSLAIVGCGDLGRRLAEGLPAHWRATGLRRDPSALGPPLAALAADYTRPGSLGVLAELAPDYVVAMPKPAGRDAAGYRAGFTAAAANILEGLGGHRPRGICMVSSTRVYAEGAGGWVDEGGALAEEDEVAAAIIDAERRLLASGLPVAILRCGGIYGTPGGRLLGRVADGSICRPEPVRYSNRIHRDDVAGFIAHLLGMAEEGLAWSPVYNLVDDCPAPQHDVEAWLARELGVAAIADREPGAAHKRCRNGALAGSGYRLRFPDYRAGYRALLAAGRP